MAYLDYQRDPEYYDEIMTSATADKDPLKRSWKDRLGDYGCLVTSLSNIILMTINNKMDPKILNGLIRDNKGYQYLGNPNTPEDKASVLRWDVFEKMFPQFAFDLNVNIYEDDLKSFYIAKVHLFTNDDEHFINVLRRLTPSLYLCFDVWDSKVKLYSRDKILSFHRIKLK